MRLQRVLEPEVMDSEQEAGDYDAIDNREVNEQFCADVLAVAPAPRRALDVGTGTALIPIALCRRAAGVHVVAIDMADSMLALARRNVERAGLASRIELARRDAKDTGYPRGFDLALSNSIVHHIPEPLETLREMVRVVESGGVVFVRDLARPPSDADVLRLVEMHAEVPDGVPAPERDVYLRQRALFEASLRAALTVEEVNELIRELPFSSVDLRMTSDRHWTLVGRVR